MTDAFYLDSMTMMMMMRVGVCCSARATHGMEMRSAMRACSRRCSTPRARPHPPKQHPPQHHAHPQVNIGLRVLTRPIPAKLPEIYRTLGTDYAERVLPSIIQETLKSVIAQYNASQLLTMREARACVAACVCALKCAGGWLD